MNTNGTVQARYLVIQVWTVARIQKGWLPIGVIVQVNGEVHCRFLTSMRDYRRLKLFFAQTRFKNLTRTHTNLLTKPVITDFPQQDDGTVPSLTPNHPKLLTFIYRYWSDETLYYGRPKKKKCLGWLSSDAIVNLIFDLEVSSKLPPHSTP